MQFESSYRSSKGSRIRPRNPESTGTSDACGEIAMCSIGDEDTHIKSVTVSQQRQTHLESHDPEATASQKTELNEQPERQVAATIHQWTGTAASVLR